VDIACKVRPDFDHPPAGSYVNEDIRHEVWNIIQSYQPLTHLTVSPTVHINRHNLESFDNYHAHFHDPSTLPLMAMIARLQNPGSGPHTNAIDNLDPDTYICDLIVTNSNGTESKFPIRRSY
jgi:hypothetical protein